MNAEGTYPKEPGYYWAMSNKDLGTWNLIGEVSGQAPHLRLRILCCLGMACNYDALNAFWDPRIPDPADPGDLFL